MLLNNVHAVTPMFAETKRHCKVRAHTMDPLFPERMLFVERREEFVLLKWCIGTNLLLVISSLQFHKTTMCFITSLTVVCNFDALAWNNKEPVRWMGCWETPAACSSCELSWCFNESELYQAECSLEPPRTLAGIAGKHRGSEHPQMNLQAERSGQAGIHLSRPVTLTTYTSTGDQLGSSWLNKGHCSDKQGH